jgi:hypothetical protein
MQQEPFRGVRSTKFAIVRQHYPELTTTTMKTVTSFLPEKTQKGYSFTINRSKPMIGYLTIELPDKTVVNSEWVFLALDDDSDSVKLRSLDCTMGWINEASEITKLNFTTLCGRVGRFPAVKDGGCTYSGVILDSNPPTIEHFLYEIFEQEKPPGHVIWHQPPGVLELPRTNPNDPIKYIANLGQDPNIPCAENLQWLPPDYYMKQTYSASREFIKVFLMGQYGRVLTGKPVYPEFQSEVHVAKEELKPYLGIPLILGFDYGVTPSCVMAQISPRGQLTYIDELVCGLGERELSKRDKSRYFSDMGIRNFALNHLRPYLNNVYGGMEIACTGDPMGNQRSQTDEQTCQDELAACGFNVVPAESNNFIRRREAVEGFMMRRGGLLVSPRCHYLVTGFQGGYRYRMVAKPNGEAYTYEPEKNQYSHPHDAAQYIAMWAESVGSKTGSAMPGMINQRAQRRDVVPSSYGSYI